MRDYVECCERSGHDPGDGGSVDLLYGARERKRMTTTTPEPAPVVLVDGEPDHRVALDNVARTLGASEVLPITGDVGVGVSTLVRYAFPALTGALVFAEIVDHRATKDSYRTSHPCYMSDGWTVYVKVAAA